MMKVVFLGTGTSTGNPVIGCHCEVCTSKDPRDWRMRSSILVETEGKQILIDCGPDFRWQMLKNKISHLDAVLLTHEHYDHVGGLDDLRPFSRQKDVDIYAEDIVNKAIHTRMPYVFRTNNLSWVPSLLLHTIENKPFVASGVEIIPIRLMHGKLPIFGYRIGNMAYLTDIKYMPDEEYDKLRGLDVLIIDALRREQHPSHECLDDALENIRRIQPKEAYLIHMCHSIGLHAEIEKELPSHIHYSYDGLTLEF